MGHTSQFDHVNRLLRKHLGYALDPDHALAFRGYLRQAGLRQTEAAILLTASEHPESPSEAHTILQGILWSMIWPRPAKRRLRSPKSNVGRAVHADMDARVMELVGDPRQ